MHLVMHRLNIRFKVNFFKNAMMVIMIMMMIMMMTDDGYLLQVIFCRAVFLQRRSRELLDNDELQVCIFFFLEV